MKLSIRKKRLLLVLGLLLVVSAVFIIYGSAKERRYMQSPHWQAFLKNDDFLSVRHDVGVQSYGEAVHLLKEHGIDADFFEKGPLDDQCRQSWTSVSKEFTKLVMRGAKSKRLGIKKPEPLKTDIYTLEGETFPFEDFKLLSKAIDYFAQEELRAKNLDEAIILGKVSMVLGVQLSELYDVDFIHMYGLVCKDQGLRTLNDIEKRRNDKDLRSWLSTLRLDLNKEFDVIKGMPVRIPSFWSFFYESISPSSPQDHNTNSSP